MDECAEVLSSLVELDMEPGQHAVQPFLDSIQHLLRFVKQLISLDKTPNVLYLRANRPDLSLYCSHLPLDDFPELVHRALVHPQTTELVANRQSDHVLEGVLVQLGPSQRYGGRAQTFGGCFHRRWEAGDGWFGGGPMPGSKLILKRCVNNHTWT